MLAPLREELGADFVVVNGENAAGGIGITPEARRRALQGRRRRHHPRQPHLSPSRGVALPRGRREIVRPANFLATQPGRGTATVERGGVTLGVVNLAGNLYMPHAAPALLATDDACARSPAPTSSSWTCMRRRRARRSRSAGTWTARSRRSWGPTRMCRPRTAGAPSGTAYISDVGMTGARGGVIGVRREQSISTMRTHMPQRYEPAEEDPWINAVVVRCGPDGRATEIEQVLRPLQA